MGEIFLRSSSSEQRCDISNGGEMAAAAKWRSLPFLIQILLKSNLPLIAPPYFSHVQSQIFDFFIIVPQAKFSCARPHLNGVTISQTVTKRGRAPINKVRHFLGQFLMKTDLPKLPRSISHMPNQKYLNFL